MTTKKVWIAEMDSLAGGLRLTSSTKAGIVAEVKAEANKRLGLDTLKWRKGPDGREYASSKSGNHMATIRPSYEGEVVDEASDEARDRARRIAETALRINEQYSSPMAGSWWQQLADEKAAAGKVRAGLANYKRTSRGDFADLLVQVDGQTIEVQGLFSGDATEAAHIIRGA